MTLVRPPAKNDGHTQGLPFPMTLIVAAYLEKRSRRRA
ncbi:hypothetical protein [Azospirillum doebereinerae]